MRWPAQSRIASVYSEMAASRILIRAPNIAAPEMRDRRRWDRADALVFIPVRVVIGL